MLEPPPSGMLISPWRFFEAWQGTTVAEHTIRNTAVNFFDADVNTFICQMA
jgi:hypothetical protein